MARSKRHPSSGSFSKDPLDIPSLVSSSRPNFLSTFDCESRYPIFSTFCDCLSVAEIISLTRTCKSLSGLYQYLLPRQWDVDKALSRYLDDPLDFRAQMAKCDALICGYFAAQYFERVVWEDKPMPVVVHQGVGSELFSDYLSKTAGYANAKIITYPQSDYIIETRIFERNVVSKTEIHLQITQSSPVESILIETDTTAGLSLLSWNKAYCLFALPTSIQHKSYLLHDRDESAWRAVRYDSQSGWNVQGTMWPEEQRNNHPIRERRRVGDRYTWTIPFDTRQVEWSKTPDFVLEYASFKVDLSQSYVDGNRYDRKEEDVRHYTIEVNKLKSRVLKHVYCYGEDSMWEFFLPRLHSSQMLELRKLDPAQRPTNYDEIMSNRLNLYDALEGFDRPASWTYRDDDFPTWYKAFEKYHPEKS